MKTKQAFFLSSSSYFRFLNGFADVAAWTSIISILITLFPNNVASVLSWTEVLTGLGYILGKHVKAIEQIIKDDKKTLIPIIHQILLIDFF